MNDQDFVAELARRLEIAAAEYRSARDEMETVRGKLDASVIALKALAARSGPEAKAKVREFLGIADGPRIGRRYRQRAASAPEGSRRPAAPPEDRS